MSYSKWHDMMRQWKEERYYDKDDSENDTKDSHNNDSHNDDKGNHDNDLVKW